MKAKVVPTLQKKLQTKGEGSIQVKCTEDIFTYSNTFKRNYMLTLSCLVWSGGLFAAKPAVDGQFPAATDPEG